ncbi:MAG: type II 3-dehydroquinate dehydratase [Succinivibrio sp.]|nr:type II 3-dehydroquinate dehydratase [Succinivibrio sp.]MCI7772859.1 type II 3-dehydroquinate dehydratase [Succinivibrio sp.]MDD7287995.1 type II 3-dehydroquinate dehydratase [Succinivibrio sp.]MDY5189348.1 type II 3-dehydroquinate dehydratase [Succinivibrio sp.]
MLAKYSILVVNGPNLNMLGVREPEIYGHETLKDLEKMLQNVADELDVKIEFYQSNHEGDIVDTIQQSYKKVDFILLNAGAYTHTSVAIRDALAGIDMPFYEIHISNVHKREEFRHHSFLSDVAVGVIVGFGLDGYEFALRGAVRYLDRKHQE